MQHESSSGSVLALLTVCTGCKRSHPIGQTQPSHLLCLAASLQLQVGQQREEAPQQVPHLLVCNHHVCRLCSSTLRTLQCAALCRHSHCGAAEAAASPGVALPPPGRLSEKLCHSAKRLLTQDVSQASFSHAALRSVRGMRVPACRWTRTGCKRGTKPSSQACVQTNVPCSVDEVQGGQWRHGLRHGARPPSLWSEPLLPGHRKLQPTCPSSSSRVTKRLGVFAARSAFVKS